ncbi:P27 family phage terminase small subunit [Sphingomonas canadensis]|uniref:P27 family phage terminase small subunit n=1 Tax=Sphingomonas canadensis TaxID=1219257 RepID=A0ABW3HD50_9SPHN|nr:P27 family phage terminase small subunit [Sphingomonas canadensis]MCW3837824.1 P27 family phage terminase small subunit [Sphingomonas canadensis]
MGSGGPRPGAGRKRKDPALKLLAGTDRQDRQLAIGEDVPLGPMIAPLHLTDLEQLMFGSIARMLEEQKRASPHFAEHVALLAQRLAQIQRLKAVLEIEGDTYSTETIRTVAGRAVITRMVRARPEVTMLSDAMRQAQSLLGELMLNPSAAMRLASGHKADPGAFDDF